jgi:DNA invertase Pin-like site-specific DNA recombinase
MVRKFEPAVAYLRTSSATNVGAEKDSDKRQRAAIEAFSKGAGFTIVDEYYDKAVSGADRIDERPGFREMLQRLAANGQTPSSSNRPIGSPVTSLCS